MQTGTESFIQPKSCEDCPFNNSGPGLHLRNSLASGRMDSIIEDLRTGKVFNCHKTTKETGDGTEKVCAGALALQRKENCVPQGIQIAERITAINHGRRARW